MTSHLYYEDSYLTEFSAEVLEMRPRGDRFDAVLNRTAFYPTSGGQPHDTGALADTRVIEVVEEESGTVLHLLESAIPLGPVIGRVDWARRFDFMQQHTGQHILSQAFIQTASAPTLSFHLGQDYCTIDIELAQPAPAAMQEAERLACGVVFENRPVHILKANRAGLAALGIRKESQREGEIRVIDVERFDRSACGGTHVRYTGEVGLIAILGYERYKGGTRVEFACGARALKTLQKDHEVLKTLGRLYSGHPYELPRLTEKLMEERSSLARENIRLQAMVLELEALDLFHRAEIVSGTRIVEVRFTERTIEDVKLLAQKAAAHPGTIAVMAIVQETAQVVVAKSADLQVNCGAAIKAVTGQLGGRGGGRAELAQAGGVDPAALDGWIRAIIAHLLPAPP